MPNYDTNKVFTPTTPAINTFVARDHKINKHLRDALNTPGKQIVLYGHSGCGKTTLITNELKKIYENHVTTRCMDGMTFDNIILDAFDQLGKFYKETTSKNELKIAPEVSVDYLDIKGSIKLFELSRQKETTHKSFVPPQLTPQRLGKFFGESKCCWILEDFHKISGREKTKTSQIMKVFMDMAVDYAELKLIALGAVGTARQVIEYDKEMNNRVSEILIPYMKEIEIEGIIETGEQLLNIKFNKAVKDKIVTYSCGLPSICHQLCLNICFNKGILKTQKDKVTFTLADFDEAIEKFVEERSDTLKAEFDKAIKVPNHSSVNRPIEVLKAALRTGKDEFSFDDVFVKISDRKSQRTEIEKVLLELCSTNRSEILVYDENSNKYRFNNLFTKSYVSLRFSDEEETEVKPKSRRDQKIVDRLLEIIEKDLADDLDPFEDEL